MGVKNKVEMNVKKIFLDDLHIAQALIKRDECVTRQFFYKQCYPLFKSFYNNYHTDCCSCLEFINEIYIVVLSPSKKTGHCQMENYRGESTLTKWLQSACLFYCYGKYQRKQQLSSISSSESLLSPNCFVESDSFGRDAYSNNIDISQLNVADVECIINMMPNKRYAQIIRLRYLQQMSNEETAEALGLSIDNYYNKHKLAKAQYVRTLRKEESHG